MKKDTAKLAEVSKRIKQALDYKDMSQQELSRISGVSKSSISQYISQFSAPSKMTAERLARALGVNPLWIMGLDVPMKQDNPASDTGFDNIFALNIRRYPMLGSVACGKPIFMSEERNYYMSGTDIKADFCFRAKGNSMSGTIQDGDIVFVRQQPEVENGEIAAVAIDDEATVKRFYQDPETKTITLVPDNKSYPPLVYTESGGKKVYILGKVVGLQRTNL